MYWKSILRSGSRYNKSSDYVAPESKTVLSKSCLDALLPQVITIRIAIFVYLRFLFPSMYFLMILQSLFVGKLQAANIALESFIVDGEIRTRVRYKPNLK